MSSAYNRGSASLFAPLFLMLSSLLAMAGFETYQLWTDEQSLESLRIGQEGALEESRRVRAQLQAIARGTAELAAAGNENAQRVVDSLESQGFTLSAEGLPDATP
ncbi:MAG: hypothetical protein ACR2QB_05095 [Gammaproteobacteria bacterium]